MVNIGIGEKHEVLILRALWKFELIVMDACLLPLFSLSGESEPREHIHFKTPGKYTNST